MQPQDRSLHFAVRHEGYKQRAYYGAYLNHVLAELNDHPPQSAKQLLTDTADLMSGRLHWEDGQRTYQPVGSKFNKMAALIEKADEDLPINELFGPVADAEFGALISNPEQDASWLFITVADVNSQNTSHQKPRAYAQIIGQNQTLSSHGSGDICQFEYTTKDGQTLDLMQIKRGQAIAQEIQRQGKIQHLEKAEIESALKLYDRAKLAYFHPIIEQSEFNVLAAALQENLNVLELDKQPSNNSHSENLPKEKKEALATIYWLAAQTTPVVRGGSAYANVILQHLGRRLQEQGYDYEVPYTKDGTDLWAEAASTDLDVFKERFSQGTYFDPTLSDSQVRKTLNELHLVNKDRVAPDIVITNNVISGNMEPPKQGL